MVSDFVNRINGTMDVIVVSYGGSGSTTLSNILTKNGYKFEDDHMYIKYLCHYPDYISLDIPIIYIYDDPKHSLLSMRRRGDGIWNINQDKLGLLKPTKHEHSDENLLRLMIEQFHNWTSEEHDNVLVIHTRELFQQSIKTKLDKFLKKDLKHLPVSYIKPKTNMSHVTQDDIELFNKYSSYINHINNFQPQKKI
jgi:hypothetical protein